MNQYGINPRHPPQSGSLSVMYLSVQLTAQSGHFPLKQARLASSAQPAPECRVSGMEAP